MEPLREDEDGEDVWRDLREKGLAWTRMACHVSKEQLRTLAFQ